MRAIPERNHTDVDGIPRTVGISEKELTMKYYVGLCCALLGISVSISDAQELPARELRQVFAANDFVQPLFLTHAGDGSDRIFVVEKPGRIKVMPNVDDAVATDFLDIRDQVNPVSEGGLLSVAFHPEHGTNGLFYVYYTRGTFFSRVSEFRVSGDPNVADVESERVLWEVSQPATNHNGGQLAFGPDGMLYVGLGDGGGGGDTFRNGQDPTTWLAAILRIDVDARTAGLQYGIPPDNPFVGNSQDWREDIWAYGLRNPWRFSFDRKSGQLWAGDVGQSLWEEVDVIEKGANYGWNRMEGFHCFSPQTNCDTVGLTLPVFEYGHDVGASITGGYVYRAARLSGLYGVYIYGDFVSKRIWGLRYEEDKVRSNDLIATSPSSISSFGEDESGEVYIVGFEGPIYLIELLPGEMPTAVLSEEGELPQAHALHQNYPNPFNPSTTISFTVATSGPVELSVFDLLGRRVRILTEGPRPSGQHTVVWDGTDEKERAVGSGIYVYRLRIADFVQTRKMVLVK